MVASALEAARDRGDVLSSLYPFRASFYARLGYGLCGETHQYLLAPSALPASEERAGVEMLEGEDDVDEIADFYERWAVTQTGQVKRRAQVWRDHVNASDRALVGFRGTDGRLSGYALATYPTHLPPHDRYLSVEEHAWTTGEARRALYGWMASMGDQWRGVAVRALPEHRLQDWVREPRLSGTSLLQWGLWFPSAVLLRGPMFRVLDLAAAWRLRSVAPGAAMTVGLEVEDPQVPSNSGSWRLRLEGGEVAVEKAGGRTDLDLRLDIPTLSRLYMGSLPATAAVENDLAWADGKGALSDLDAALRLPGCWTFDRY
jgi:predicted acetyltransferase